MLGTARSDNEVEVCGCWLESRCSLLVPELAANARWLARRSRAMFTRRAVAVECQRRMETALTWPCGGRGGGWREGAKSESIKWSPARPRPSRASWAEGGRQCAQSERLARAPTVLPPAESQPHGGAAQATGKMACGCCERVAADRRNCAHVELVRTIAAAPATATASLAPASGLRANYKICARPSTSQLSNTLRTHPQRRCTFQPSTLNLKPSIQI